MHLLMKDCDSGVHTVVNLANSFNTDVGYSSETSRAASHPSSVAFKRRSFTNKSASQNYSSPTESLGSQAGHGDAIGCSQSPSPSPMDGFSRPGRPADPRRLSYKRFFFFFCLITSFLKWLFFQSIQSFTICYGMILIVMFLPFACLQKSVRSR